MKASAEDRSHRVRALFVVLCASVAFAQGPAQAPKSPLAPKAAPQTTVAPTTPQPHPPAQMTPADLEAFFDGLIPLQIQRDDIAGAVVCVVRGGQVLFAKGYGYQDADKKIPVTPDTLFRPGSISKLFTWTAVMQLVEQGKLDLDRDVNAYLDYKIPDAFGKPITLRNLMTHTPGFEETVKDLIQPDPKRLTPLAAYMKTHIPARIFPPGTIPAYSNYGAGLAGYIVERVSGVPFNHYVKQAIFDPLQMTHATFDQPLPDEMKQFMSQGYNRASDGSKQFEVVQPAPAGALSVSAADLAHFIIAHLQDGEYQDRQILLPRTAREMHARQFGLDPAMNSMALGFYEESRNGHRIIGHGGDTQYFHSDLHLMEDADLGFYVSYNSAGRGDTSPRTALWQHFLDRYFPYTPAEIKAPATAKDDARQVAGCYMTSRRFQTTILRAATLLNVMSVTPGPDGTVIADAMRGFNGKTKRWQEMGFEYRAKDSQDRIAFRRDGNNELLVVDFPAVTYLKVPWYWSKTFTICVVVLVMGIFILTLLIWLISYLVRRHYARPLPLTGFICRTRFWSRIAIAAELIALGAWLLLLTFGFSRLSMLTSKSDWLIHLIQIVALLGLIGALAALVHLIIIWRTNQVRLWNKITETSLALAAVGYVWLIVTWNVLHFTLNY